METYEIVRLSFKEKMEASKAEHICKILMEQHGIRCNMSRFNGALHIFFRNIPIEPDPTNRIFGTIRNHICSIGLGLEYRINTSIHENEEFVIYQAWEQLSYLPFIFYNLMEGDSFNQVDETAKDGIRILELLRYAQTKIMTEQESRAAIQLTNRFILNKPIPETDIERIIRNPISNISAVKDAVMIKKYLRLYGENFEKLEIYSAAEVYSLYRIYCKERNFNAVSRTEFGAILKTFGYTSKPRWLKWEERRDKREIIRSFQKVKR